MHAVSLIDFISVHGFIHRLIAWLTMQLIDKGNGSNSPSRARLTQELQTNSSNKRISHSISTICANYLMFGQQLGLYT